jgi:hypothetical protein
MKKLIATKHLYMALKFRALKVVLFLFSFVQILLRLLLQNSQGRHKWE